MIKISKPFKGATPQSITQGFKPKEHEANDWVAPYGTFLVAPFNARVLVIRGVQQASDVVVGDNGFLEGGCGIRLQSIEDPTFSLTYWHCQEVFPVSVGDVVMQGQPVAQLGNTGFVMSNGIVVPYDIRTKPPFPGAHTHISCGTQTKNMDYSTLIDYSIPINYDAVAVINALIKKIMEFLKK